ncbi:Importin alpha subunit (Karyopherin alpha subunit) (Serine-rich RNA polymerase I suppressor protein) [Physocladia obscura]|uniref:Importin subunit alpha n=1 Tax=Physocladia obscura TaxID=109957 RepID=A0AAD5T236_9FUNG|nr:Importin alpha subunit (Karyopherin alpha subunit) (Serine-rich RNA polymerase I suppressor protein) [Physocladia obscura]
MLANARAAAFKNKGMMKSDELRRRREEISVEIRKAKKEEALVKRRNLKVADDDASTNSDSDASENDSDLLKFGSHETALVQRAQEIIPGLVEAVFSSATELQYDALVKFRKILSKERDPPIEEVIACGVVPRFVQFLLSDNHLIQFEAAWALTNIASGSSAQTQVVIDHNAIPIFVTLLRAQSADVREQAVWALGNIAGDSPRCRDIVLGCGALQPLLDIFNETKKVSMLKNAAWTLSNLCRGNNPPPQWTSISRALPTLSKLLYSDENEVIADACWAISYVSNGPHEQIQSVIESGICRRLVELLQHPSAAVHTPALRSVGNIVTGDDVQTQIMLNLGCLPNLISLLNSPKENIRKEVCWTVSNITAGTTTQIDAVINSNMFPPLIEILAHGDYKTKKDACWAVSNATTGGVAAPYQIRYLVQQGVISPLCDILTISDSRIVQVALDALENILKIGEADKAINNGVNIYADNIDSAGGMEKIYVLQNHDNNEIYQKSYQIIQKYYSEENEETGIDEAEIDDVTGTFKFSTVDTNFEQGFSFN